MADVLSTLPPKEKEILALCGITTNAQLAQADINSLMMDMRKARKIFADDSIEIPRIRLRQICDMAASTNDEPAASDSTGKAAPATAPATVAAVPAPRAPFSELEDVEPEQPQEQEQPRALPELVLRKHQHRRSNADKRARNMKDAPGVDSSVHCSRPITTYFAALFMVMFYGGLLWFCIIPFMIFTGNMETDYVFHYALAGFVALIPYATIGMWCHCSVCKMRMFTLVPYYLNRHAHTIPYLGLTTLLTALHILAFRWYRCPACGTSIRLFRSRHSHHRHH